MTPNRPEAPMSDLETLSALFDGELDADAARFATKRLGHDTGWQQACGRWQLVGDVLRGNATSAASSDFAARVTEAVAREAVPFMVPEPRAAAPAPARAKPRRWMAGAALAASVAAAALFVARPGLEPQPVASPSIAAEPAVPVPTAVSDASTTVAAAPALPAVDTAPAAAMNEPVVARSAAPRTRALVTRDLERMARASAATAALAAQSVASTTSSPALAESVADPFHPSRAAITTRPWPRAVLPGSAAAGALTASFGSAPQSGSPSFYPFEPRLPAEIATNNAAPQP